MNDDTGPERALNQQSFDKTTRWLDVVLLTLTAGTLFLVSVGARDLWNPNEPIYGLAVREMFEAGEWQVPTVNGKVFAEKPILYFWAALAAAKTLGGVDEFTLRLPAALAAIASVLLVYVWVFPYVGRQRALMASFIFSTTYIVFWSARNVQMDIFVLLTTLATMIPLGRMLDHGLNPRRAWLLASLALGVGLLAKGPVTLILPGVIFLLHCWIAKRSPIEHWRYMGLAFLLILVVASPWYLALLIEGRSDVLYEVLIRQNFQRFTSAWDHRQPWWYYLKYFWLDMAPWSFFLPLGIGLRGRSQGESSLHRLSWMWIVGVIFFFSLSESKRAPYILPIAPAVAVLAAEVFDRIALGALGVWRNILGRLVYAGFGTLALIAGGLVAGLVAAGHPILSQYDGLDSVANTLGAALALFGLTLIVTVAIAKPTTKLLAPVLAMALAGLYIVTVVIVLPAVNPLKSARGFCQELNQLVDEESELSSYRFWAWRSGYPYYCQRTIPNLESPSELTVYWRREGTAYLLVEGKHLEEASQILLLGPPLLHRRIGSREAFLFSTDQPRESDLNQVPALSSKDSVGVEATSDSNRDSTRMSEPRTQGVSDGVEKSAVSTAPTPTPLEAAK